MNQNNRPRERKIGTKTTEKKPLIDPRYKNLITTVAVMVVIAVFFIINNSQSEPAQGPYPPDHNPQSGLAQAGNKRSAPEFSLLSTTGKKVSLSDFKGKVVIVDFWATWCPPCRKGIPDLVSLKKQYQDKGVEIIGISLDQEQTKDDVVPFIKNYGINYPVLYYNMKVISDYGNIQSIPTSFVIDKEGKIISSYVGLVDRSVYEADIKKALAGS